MTNMTQDAIVEELNLKRRDHFDLESMTLRETLYYQAISDNPDAPRCIQVATGFASFLHEKPIIIQEYDLLAGLLQHYKMSSSMPILYEHDYDPRYWPTSKRRPDTRRILRSCAEKYGFQTSEANAILSIEDEMICGLIHHQPYSHAIPGFYKLIYHGIDAVLISIEQSWPVYSKEKERCDMLQSMKIALQAASEYIQRYGEKATQVLSQTEDPQKRNNLLRIADSCKRISHKAAENFFDAIQFATIIQELTTIETSCGSMSLGRVDQLFYPYYEADLRTGQITMEEAQYLIDAWRIKISGLVQGFQNAVICGCDENGKFAGNDVSLMIIRSAKRLRFDQPLLSLRYTSDMPDEYWNEAMELLSLGDGFPAFHNDRVIISSLVESGVAVKDAWNYAIVGCVEQNIPGAEFSNTEELRINWLKILELMLNHGKCSITGKHIDLKCSKSLNEIVSFEDFYAWYKEELLFVIEKSMQRCTLVDAVYYMSFPSPFLSSTIEGCIENARDVADCIGPTYRFSTINNCGMSNLVDSLLAIKKMVFEEKLLSLSELSQVLLLDYEGHEALRQYAINQCEKFGNDTAAANTMMKELIDMAAGAIRTQKNGRGFHYRTGMYSVAQHATLGLLTAASPDGRKRATALSNGLSPVQGRDVKGPTALIKALTTFDHKQFGNGMVLDMKIMPNMFKQPERRIILRFLIETYFKRGGMEIQFNVVDRKTLLAAQDHPECYRDLIVRVSGFSAYFVSLIKSLQDEIIARTEIEDF